MNIPPDYKIIRSVKKYDTDTLILEHITNPDITIKIVYYESGLIESETKYLNYINHCEDGPAYISYYESGQIETKMWRTKGLLHNKTGSAWISYYESGGIKRESWHIKNQVHNKIKPAIIEYNQLGIITNQQFYLNNIEYTYSDFIQRPEYQIYLKRKSITIFD